MKHLESSLTRAALLFFSPHPLEVSEEGCNFVGDKKKIRKEDMRVFKLPRALVGCRKEEDFRRLIDENNMRLLLPETVFGFKGNFFKNIQDLEFENLNQFNKELYRSFVGFYEKETGMSPSDETTLWVFNNAYRIALDGMYETLFNIRKRVEDLSKIVIEEGTSYYTFLRDKEEVVAVLCMAHNIFGEEEKSNEKAQGIRYLIKGAYDSFIREMEYAALPTISADTVITFTEDKEKQNAEHRMETDTGEPNAADNEKKIRAAIEEWLKEAERKKNQWFAVFKALEVRGHQADDMENFCNRMHEWGYDKKHLSYDSVSKVNQWGLPDKPSDWIPLQRTETGKELKMIKAYIAFTECLRKQGL